MHSSIGSIQYSLVALSSGPGVSYRSANFAICHSVIQFILAVSRHLNLNTPPLHHMLIFLFSSKKKLHFPQPPYNNNRLCRFALTEA
jgi:hypothetical protein